jgi:large subunit ribosomal protein L32e
MSDLKALLALRKQIKDKKPEFIRPQAGKKKKVDVKWRQPGGHHSKLRHRMSGKGNYVEIGWGSPAAVRGLHRSGLKMVIVYNVDGLKKLNIKLEGALIANVGDRKKIEIIKAAEKMGIKVLNVKDSKKFISDVESALKQRKDFRASRLSKDKDKKSGKKEEKKEPEMSAEDKAEQQKKEAEKVMISKSG